MLVVCSRAGGMTVETVLVASAILDPDGSTQEAEGFADLVFQKALIGKVELYGAVGEEDEGGEATPA